MNTGLSHDEAGWFARFHCDCGLDRLVAFSCKGRGYAVHCIGGASARVAAGAGRPPQRAESARRGLRDDRTGRAPGGQRLGLDVDFHVGPRVVGVRVVVLPGREAAMTRLCTNLPRTSFSLDLGGRLYRFSRPSARCFKEWTSHANLHQFDTANVHIAEGLIWASLCAAILKRFLAPVRASHPRRPRRRVAPRRRSSRDSPSESQVLAREGRLSDHL